MRRAFLGHFWTVGPHVASSMRGEPCPRDEPWAAVVPDPRFGAVRITGWLRVRPHSDALVVIIHGLGGSTESRYVVRCARAVDEAGLSYLRLNCRGADRSGEDLYHAALTEDLRAAFASPELASFRELYVIGYSMGGHITLRWATESLRDPRVRSIAAICAPLDLDFGAHEIQRPLGRPYQWHVLRGLKDMYRAMVQRREGPVPLGDALAVRTILEWDERIVAPRFGFPSRKAYYEQASAGPVLRHVQVPTLFVAAQHDPMVTAHQLRPWLREVGAPVEVAWTARGGHVGFPDDLDLGLGNVGALEPQVVRWLMRHRG